MSLKKYVLTFQRINYLVRIQSTGNPQEFARKLGVSERQLFNYLKDLKELGFEIEYSSSIESYKFSNEIYLNKPELKKIIDSFDATI